MRDAKVTTFGWKVKIPVLAIVPFQWNLMVTYLKSIFRFLLYYCYISLSDLRLKENESPFAKEGTERMSSAELWTIVSIVCGFSFLALLVSISFLGHRYMKLKKRRLLLCKNCSQITFYYYY